MKSFYLTISLCVVCAAMMGCGDDSRSCTTAGDCFQGEACTDGVCVEDEPGNNGGTNNGGTNNGGTNNGGTNNGGTNNGGTNNGGTNNGGTNNGTQEPRFVDLTAGGDFTCALEVGGRVWCWGENTDGRLHVSIDEDEVSNPWPVEGVSDVTDISAGRFHICALKSDGYVDCWGRNYGLTSGDSSKIVSPTEMPISDIAAIDLGWYTACALETDQKTLSCWGDDEAGVPPTFAQKVVDFAVGEDHVCAALDSGDVRCWGSDYYDQIGLGDPVQGISDVEKIDAGKRHNCAVKSDGTVWCWGWNEEGQCGRIPEDFQEKHELPVEVESIENAIDVFAGDPYTCALLEGGTLSCWGGLEGYEAHELVASDLFPPTIPFGLGKDVRLVGAGHIHTCAEKENDIWCWGANQSHQLGEGGQKFRYTQPVKVEFLDIEQ